MCGVLEFSSFFTIDEWFKKGKGTLENAKVVVGLMEFYRASIVEVRYSLLGFDGRMVKTR